MCLWPDLPYDTHLHIDISMLQPELLRHYPQALVNSQQLSTQHTTSAFMLFIMYYQLSNTKPGSCLHTKRKTVSSVQDFYI